MMKAMIYTEFGSPEVLRLGEVAQPAPRAGEIRIKVAATTAGFGDVTARNFRAISPFKFWMPLPLWLPTRLYFGLRKPRITILGSEFAGVVDAVGKGVTRFKAGDRAFGYRGPAFGANAEYLCMRADGIVAHMPANMTFAEAAAVPYGALTALSLLRSANVQRGQKVLVVGASGAIGSAAVQLATGCGAEVTGVCGPAGLALVKSLGAVEAIDYTREDFTSRGETYDLIFDVPGRASFARCKGSLKEGGRYLPVSFKMTQVFQMLWTALRGGKRVVCALSADKPEDLVYIKNLIEAGQYKAAIDRRYPLEQVAEAHRRVEQGGRRGSVVVLVAGDR